MTRTFALIGAGPLTGLATAKRFGRDGYRVGMVARRRASLDGLEHELESEGIEARGFVGDVSDQDSLRRALSRLQDAFGHVDALLYAPSGMPPGDMQFTPPSEVTVERARAAFELRVSGAITTVRELLPAMLQRSEGTILVAIGRSAIQPMKALGEISLSTPALRSYIYELHDELKSRGVYAGLITISALIDQDHAAKIAAILHDMHRKRDRIEATYGDDMAVLEEISKLSQRAVNEFVWPDAVPMR